MTRYFIALGSNIDPYRNVPEMLTALLAILPRLHISRILETCPVGIDDAPKFLNLAASFLSDKNQATLKMSFNKIEISLGRDRQNRVSKWQNRTADIDILFSLPAEQTAISPEFIPDEPYVRPVVLELLQALRFDCREIRTVELRPGVEVSIAGNTIGQEPVMLRRIGRDEITVTKSLGLDQ